MTVGRETLEKMENGRWCIAEGWRRGKCEIATKGIPEFLLSLSLSVILLRLFRQWPVDIEFFPPNLLSSTRFLEELRKMRWKISFNQESNCEIFHGIKIRKKKFTWKFLEIKLYA